MLRVSVLLGARAPPAQAFAALVELPAGVLNVAGVECFGPTIELAALVHNYLPGARSRSTYPSRALSSWGRSCFLRETTPSAARVPSGRRG
jgi:hypothetical protein